MRSSATDQPPNSAQAAAKRDQALARLFYTSGWTQEELAKAEGKSRQWIDKNMRLGRFLEFATTVANPENPAFSALTERAFRRYWERTDRGEGNERRPAG